MKIEVRDGKATVHTPYNKDFVARIKQIGGAKWNGASKCWEVPEAEVDTVREYMRDVYGETDLPDEGDRVTVEVTFPEGATDWDGEISLFGRQICRAFGRDSGAKVGEGVTLLEGKIGSGGSRAHWTVWIGEGTKFRIRNLPRTALSIEAPCAIEVKEIQKESFDREALVTEREKLMARLEEINALLDG